MKAIITVVGPDRVGIIAEVCTLLAELHISVVEISQTIMEGTFTMIMLTQWTAGAPEFDVVQSRIAAKGDETTPADHAVTVRDRDTMEQVRIPVSELKAWLAEKLAF